MLRTISPVDQSVVVETKAATSQSVAETLSKASAAQSQWKTLDLAARKAKVSAYIDLIEANAAELGKDVSRTMGRPLKFTPGEVNTAVLRSRTMLHYADKALARTDVDPESAPQFSKYITKEPLGVVLVVSPWNYPWLCLVNGLIPALIAGNAVVIKPSPQTPTVADSAVKLAHDAGLGDLVSVVHSGDNQLLADLVGNETIQGVAFTGSVAGGLAVQKAAAHRTIPVALELGGNDATYVRPDIKDIKDVAANVADGAFFNTGQSCCSIERAYVHEKIYEEFLKELVEAAVNTKVGKPDEAVDIGPMVSTASAERVKKDIEDAIAAGAKLATPAKDLSSSLGPAFLSPAVLVDVPKTAKLLADETFGPVLPVVKVSSDEEAIKLINDSQYGLTSSVWTSNVEEGDKIASQLESGTVFVNRCDYPDPHLAWTGYKLSGRGCSLSPFGFDHWVKLKSHHVKKAA